MQLFNCSSVQASKSIYTWSSMSFSGHCLNSKASQTALGPSFRSCQKFFVLDACKNHCSIWWDRTCLQVIDHPVAAAVRTDPSGFQDTCLGLGRLEGLPGFGYGMGDHVFCFGPRSPLIWKQVLLFFGRPLPHILDSFCSTSTTLACPVICFPLGPKLTEGWKNWSQHHFLHLMQLDDDYKDMVHQLLR